MGDNTLDHLIVAEKEAMALIHKAKEQARVLVENAEQEANREKDRRLHEFQNFRKQSLSSSSLGAQIEAEKIRNDGIEVARGLEGRLKSKIPQAVDSVMTMLLGRH